MALTFEEAVELQKKNIVLVCMKCCMPLHPDFDRPDGPCEDWFPGRNDGGGHHELEVDEDKGKKLL